MASTTSSERSAGTLVLALSVAASLWTGRVHAEPSAADLATARELYLQAKDLRSAGDLKGALEKYQAAWQTAPTPIIGIELGRTHTQLGQLIEARETFLAIARLKVEPDETARSAAARTEAAELGEQLRPKIATLVAKVTNLPEGASPTLTVDGSNVAIVGGTATRKVNPGKHEMTLRAGGNERRDAVDVAEGETKEMTLDLSSASPAPIAGPSPGVTTPRESTEGSSLRPVLIYGGFGLGAFGVATGAVTGILAFGKASKVNDACTGTSCPESARKDVDDGRTFATISTIGFIAGGVGVAAGFIGLFALRPSDSAPAKTARVSAIPLPFPGGGAVDLRGEF
jgi:hypothetical protein